MYSYGHYNYYKNAEHSDFGIENHTMCLHGTYYVCHCPTTLQEGSVTVVVSVSVARERTVGHACTAEINPSLVAPIQNGGAVFNGDA